MDIMQDVKTAELVREYNLRLTKSLGQNFIVDHSVTRDIVNGADLTDEIIFSGVTEKLHTSFYLVGDMRNHLHCRAEVFTFSLFVDDTLIDTSCRHVVSL